MIKHFLPIALLVVSHVSLAQFVKVVADPIGTDGLDSQGVSWIDYDNDGDDDLFITTSFSPESAISTDLLYTNNGDGTFTKVTTGPLVTEDGTGRNATWADFDNDGLIDVFIANQHETFLFRNEGDGNFTKLASDPTTPVSFVSDHQGAAWGDYNNDGYVDLFLASYQLSEESHNSLFTNNGDGTFTAAPETDIVTTKGYSQDPSWIDYDQNGTLDLFVPNYGNTPNFLYSNLGDSFQAITGESINGMSFASLGASWADYDNDGDFDVLIPNNVNAMNVFFENKGDGTFDYNGSLFASTLSTSACWADFDNDGYIDVMLTGGANDKTVLFRNNGNKTFTDVSADQGINNISYSKAVAAADYDQDGFLDFFIANAHGNNHSAEDILYHNTPNSNHWLQVNLVGTLSNRSAIGAVVSVNTGSRWQFRAIQSKTGNNAQSSLRAHFGLGEHTTIDKIVVEWPGKGYQEIVDQKADEIITEIPLPVGPAGGQAYKESARQIDVTWTDNSSEETGFRIERSSNGSLFAQVGEVPANTTSFTDKTVMPGNTYSYRIASMVPGGYSTFSKTEDVVITGVTEAGSANISVFPNPAGDYVYIMRQGHPEYPVKIINAAGVVVKTVSGPIDQDEPLSIANLPSGFYILATPDSRTKVFKK